MVECTGLENRRTARYRGFESLRLRKRKPTSESGGFFIQLVYKSFLENKLGRKKKLEVSLSGSWGLICTTHFSDL